jgi:hypothetical protein
LGAVVRRIAAICRGRYAAGCWDAVMLFFTEVPLTQHRKFLSYANLPYGISTVSIPIWINLS